VLGGLILNLMPCVLPVLAIKLLSFAPSTQQTAPRRSVRASSGLFAVGVVGSFVLLGMALLALRTAGQSWGWGFQLQSPPMVMALAVLFLLIGLNLLDVFDVRALVPSQWANFHSNNPNIEALASGALAVLIATPCTAPFMGASLGLAVTLPALQALLIFFALGVGMALPFMAIAACPPLGAWLQKMLPKPGRWMSVLRRCLAVPMFVTAVWLLWVYVQQSSVKSAPVSVSAVSLWTDWRADVQAAAIARGQPVFVDFTAAWCITCQVNKSTTLGHSAVQAAFKTKNVLLLRADWTGPDAAIAAELARLGRSGLPVYALYVPGASTPQLLPEVLTIRVLEDALARL
jgi:thiol:disulfide interchange protein